MISFIIFSNILGMNPMINLHHLKFFCDAVVCNSVSEAAKINYVTQSTVSQAIIKLEKVLDTELVVHSRQKFQVTDEGRILFEQARHIFKTVQDIRDKINLNKEAPTGDLKFVTTHGLGMSFVAPSYRKMQENLPGVNMSFRLGGLTFIRNSLRQGSAEFAIVVYDSNFSQFNKQQLKKGFFRLYQHKKAPHHLIENGIVVDDFEGMYVNDLREYLVQSDKATLKISTEASGWDLVARFVEMNIGIGFFPEFLVDSRYPTIKPHPLKIPPFEYEICAIYNKGEKLSRAAGAFLDQFALGSDT